MVTYSQFEHALSDGHRLVIDAPRFAKNERKMRSSCCENLFGFSAIMLFLLLLYLVLPDAAYQKIGGRMRFAITSAQIR